MHIDRALVHDHIVSPDVIEELLSPKHAARLQRQGHEQTELLWPQLKVVIAHRRPAPIRLDSQGAPVQDTWWTGRRDGSPPERRPHPGQQLAQRERLDNVVVRSEFQAVDLVLLLSSRREQEYRHLQTLPPDILQNLESIDPGQHDVQDEQVEVITLLPNVIQSSFSVNCRQDVVSLTNEVKRQRAPERWIIFNQQNA